MSGSSELAHKIIWIRHDIQAVLVTAFELEGMVLIRSMAEKESLLSYIRKRAGDERQYHYPD
jgi:hypothetical protein